jgi:hypothetical protein
MVVAILAIRENFIIAETRITEKCLRTTGGLAQAGAWLARKFVRIFNLCARANGSETPACAKPPPRWAPFLDRARRKNREKII